mgnify:FL=1
MGTSSIHDHIVSYPRWQENDENDPREYMPTLEFYSYFLAREVCKIAIPHPLIVHEIKNALVRLARVTCMVLEIVTTL